MTQKQYDLAKRMYEYVAQASERYDIGTCAKPIKWPKFADIGMKQTHLWCVIAKIASNRHTLARRRKRAAKR